MSVWAVCCFQLTSAESCFWLLVCSGVCCEDSAAEASQSDPGSSWYWENCYFCHYRLPSVSSGQRVRQKLLLQIFTLKNTSKVTGINTCYNIKLVSQLTILSVWCPADQYWCVLPVTLLWTSWLRRLTRLGWRWSGCVLRAGRPLNHLCHSWRCTTRSATWTGQWHAGKLHT